MDPDTPHPPDGEPREPQPTPAVPEETPERPSGFPFTLCGVASFAQTGWGRLFAWQLIVAITLGGSVLLLLVQHWAPVVDRAIGEHMPAETGLKDGRLIWPDNRPEVFAHNSYLCLAVDPGGKGNHGQLADVQIELRRGSWVCRSILGYSELEYPGLDWPLTRKQAVPWWGSRRPFLLLGSAAVIGLLFWLSWLGLGLIGIWPAKIIAYYADRESGFGKLWRMSSAALLPAGILLAMGCLCYAMRLLPMMGLLILFPVHLILGGVYLFFSVFSLPKIVLDPANPFDDNSPANAEEGLDDSDPANPFAEDNEEDG